MDEMQKAVDTVLEDELLRNERIFSHPTFGKLKIQRPTPRLERLIADERRKQYHRDLKDKDILSKAEIMRHARDREIWTSEDEARETQLQRQVAGLLALLEAVDYRSYDEVVDQFFEVQRELRDLFKDEPECQDALMRYFDLDETPLKKDRNLLFEKAPNTSADELMERADRIRHQLDLLKELFEARKELTKLQATKAELLLDSLEARSERAERLAQIYYCCTRAEDGTRLWPDFEAAWDSAPEDIEAIMMEIEYFNHGLTEETKSLLQKYGFLQRVVDIESSSEGSQDHPKLSSAGESQASEQPSSSE